MNPADNNLTPSFPADQGTAPVAPVPPAPMPPSDLPPIPAFQQIQSEPAQVAPAVDSAATPQDPTANIVSGGGDEGKGNRKKILATLGVVLMLFGVGTGVFLIRNQNVLRTSAWDCSLYSFSLSENGTVTVANGSSRSEFEQQAQVFINGNLVNTFNVPALDPGEGATLGTISLPTDQSYTWTIDGTKDCDDSGSVQVDQITASCSAVVAYDEDWAQLSATDLTQLSEGDVVRFAVSGTAASGIFERARFSVNGGTAVEVLDKRPGSEDFYYEYTIPDGVTSFNVNAEVFHSELGWF